MLSSQSTTKLLHTATAGAVEAEAVHVSDFTLQLCKRSHASAAGNSSTLKCPLPLSKHEHSP